MDYLNKKQDIIKVTLIYNSNDRIKKEYKINDVINNIFKNFTLEIGVDFNSIYFLYNGQIIDKSKYILTLNDIINRDSRKSNQMVILVYSEEKKIITPQQINNKNEVKIYFVLNHEIDEMNALWNDVIKDVFMKFALNKKLDFNTLRFNYWDKKIDLKKKFIDIAKENEKLKSKIVITVFTLHSLKVFFNYNNNYQIKIDCFKEDKIKDIFNEFAVKISKNINDLNFYYGYTQINPDSNETFDQLNASEDISSLENINTNTTINNNINEKHIKVSDKIPYIPSSPSRSCLECIKSKKKYIAIILIFLLIIIVIVYIVFGVIKKKNLVIHLELVHLKLVHLELVHLDHPILLKRQI